MTVGAGGWIAFAAVVLTMLAIDLGVNARRDSTIERSVKRNAVWTGLWIAVGLGFSLVVLAFYDGAAVVTYLTAYLLEKSLSIDNVFVFVLIFAQLGIPVVQQRRVLYWGIISALIMRAALILMGIYLLQRFHWVIYPFAALIVFAAVRIIWGGKQERRVVEGSCDVCRTWVARIIPITPVLHNGRFVVREGGRRVATPLLISLILIETSDIVFALDSVPAVLAITQDPFIVYTSNAFAMLGLRSLYFLIAGVVERFRYVRYGLAAILLFVGAKMLLTDIIHIPTHISLVVIFVALGTSVVASLVPRHRSRSDRQPHLPD